MTFFNVERDFSSIFQTMEGSPEQKNRQIPASVTPQAQKSDLVSGVFSFRCRFSHANQAYLTLRFLLTKVFAREITLTDLEEILFYETVDYLNQYRNENFFSARQGWLTLKLLAEIKLSSPDWKSTKHLNAQVSILKKSGYLLSPRAFLSLETKIRPSVFLHRLNRTMRKKPPPERRMGVGYRDKGTARVYSSDGCPSWDEVAMHASFDVNKSHRDYSLPKSPLYEIRPRL
jgi:hypothetical protein